MKTGNFAFELADRLAETEREAGIARVQAAVRGGSGQTVCACGEEIAPARRAAWPKATDCIDCATRAERLRGRRR